MAQVPLDPYAPPAGRVEDVAAPGSGPALAGRGTRLAALILEALIWGIPGGILFVVLGGVTDDPTKLLSTYWLTILLLLPVSLAVNLVLLHRRSQTLGKVIMRVKIVRKDGSRAGVGRILLLRMLVPGFLGWIPILGFLFGLANALAIFTEARRCLHDYIADTIVVVA